MKKPRLVLAGAQSGAGKTSVSAGIMSALVRRGLCVQPYKVGPDYIDPAFHTFVAGRQSRNLDSWMLDGTVVRSLFLRHAPGPEAGLSVVEGVMGLFDGHLRDKTGSTAHVAELLSAPIVLIINGSGVARSAAALVHGFNSFSPETKISGVIVNMVGGRSHYEILKEIIESATGIPCFGFLAKNPDLALESRHLGLVPSAEVENLSGRLAALAEAVSVTVDLDGLMKLAASAPDMEPVSFPLSRGRPVRLGVARDRAFNFYYADNLDLLTDMGAEPVFFSPLDDAAPPSGLDGLYIGGGFPEVFAADLSANAAMLTGIKAALEGGLPAYAECGGLMYLTKSIIDFEGREHPMAGFFEESAVMTGRLQNFGYVTVAFEENTVLGPAGTLIRGHEFHHSRLEGGAAGYVLDIRKSAARSWRGGLRKKNVLAAYPHLHFYANPAVAGHFLDHCREYGRSL